MKKFLVIAFALILTLAGVSAAEQTADVKPVKKPPCQQKMVQDRAKRAAEFEQKLGLTEEQKVQAKALRQKGFENLKPVMEQIKAKRHEEMTIQRSRIDVSAQEEKLAAIDKDIKALEKQAGEIHKQNMKDFEAILTKEQKKTLKEMKKEGRQNYKANHPVGHPPMPIHRYIPPQEKK